LPGLVFVDVNEKANRITIGMEPGSQRFPAHALLKKLKIPSAAVLFVDSTAWQQL
jgi:hypothetical protein